MAVPQKPWTQRLPWIWGTAVFLLVGLLAWKQRIQVLRAIPYLRQANYDMLIIAGMLEIAYFVLQAVAAHLLFRAYHQKTRVTALTAVLLNATMLNEVLPLSGASGTVGFIYWGRRLGYGFRNTVSVNIWLTVLSYAALIPIFALCIMALSSLPSQPRRLIISTLTIFLAGSVAVISAIWATVGYAKRHDRPQDAPLKEARSIVGHVRTQLFDAIRKWQSRWSSYTLAELRKEWGRVHREPWRWLTATVLLAAIYAVRIVMLEVSFAALHANLPLNIAAYAYALTLLFSLVSLSPTTFGVVEVALVTALGWFGTPPPIAVAAMILYRLPSYWLPIPLGLISQWWLGHLTKTAETD